MTATDFAVTLQLDPAKDGSWSQDETGRLLRGRIRRGRSHALEPMRPGEMLLVMRNEDARFSPDKGVISGLDQLIPVRLYTTWTTPAVTNLSENPSAELDIVGSASVASATVARDTTESWTGGASFKVTTANLNESGIEMKKRDGTRFAVSASTAYTWTPRIKGPAGKPMKVQITFFNAGGTPIQTNQGAFTLGSGWMQPVITATAPATAATAFVRVITDGAQGVFDFWADAAFFYAGSALLPYVDGDQPGCSWSGAAHQSTSSRAANPTFLRFQGFLGDIEGGEDHLDRTATLVCIDRMALWPQMNVDLGLMTKPLLSGLILHRLVDKLEGELIANGSIEWTNVTVGNPVTGWSGTGGGTQDDINRTAALSFDHNLFEGDWVLRSLNPGTAALEGIKYNASTDLAATGSYVAVIYARAASTSVAVRFRMLRDGGVVASKTVTLTTTWQRIELEFTLSTLGTTREFDIVTDVASAEDFHADGLHCLPQARAIKRDFDAGAASFDVPVTAYDDPADVIIGDVLESEPGLMFVKAKTLAEGDALAYRDRNSRPSTAIPRAALGDGDGLLEFRDGLRYAHSVMDRVKAVTVTSRGTPTLTLQEVALWELGSEQSLSAGAKFKARFQQIGRLVGIVEKGGVDVKNDNQHTGLGHNIEVVTGASAAWLVVKGLPHNAPLDESQVTKEDAASGLAVGNHLRVAMPLQGTATSDMSNEAQRLLDKYKGRVLRVSLALAPDPDEALALAHDLEPNDLLVVRAKFQGHSPGFAKRFWVEGIEHEIERGALMATTLRLEEA